MVRRCIVPGCNSKMQASKYVKSGCPVPSFYSFPHKTRMKYERRIWLRMITQGKMDIEPNKYTRVCSLHFEKGGPTEDNPHPTLFPYNSYKVPSFERTTINSTKATDSQTISSSPKDKVLWPTSESETRLPMEDVPQLGGECEVLMEISNDPKRYHSSVPPDNSTFATFTPVVMDHHYAKTEIRIDFCTTRTTSTQTEIGTKEMTEMEDLKLKMSNKDSLLSDLFLKKTTEDDERIQRYYGLPNKKVFDGIFHIVSSGTEKMKYWSGAQSSKEKYYEQRGNKRPGPTRKLSMYMEFALTLLQLRLGLLTTFLGDLFGVSQPRVSQIFTTWINHLYQTLVPALIPWPSFSEINLKMPTKFKKNFPKTRIIIDCSEFYIQCPRKPGMQRKTYSQYKSHNTFKVLLEVTPNGTFTFVSDLWSGNVSDKFITRESGLLDLLEDGDMVMADRGFQIEYLLLPKKAKLIAPPFTRKCLYGKKKRLNVKEIRRTRLIVNHRIYVEQAIGRLKTWKFFKGPLNLKQKGIMNQAVKVAAALCNLKPSLCK